jgi:hypothetical protein
MEFIILKHDYNPHQCVQNNSDAMNYIELKCIMEYLMGTSICWKMVQWKSQVRIILKWKCL